MSVSLAQILERKRQEELGSQQNMIQGVTQGQQQAKGTAAQLTQNKRDKEAKEFNPINALVSGGTSLIASGGNPVAAGLAALGSARGKKVKPLEAVGSGATSALSVGTLDAGADAGKTLTAMTDVKNLAKTLPILKQSGVPDKILKPLEAYSKAQTAKEVITEKRGYDEKVAKTKDDAAVKAAKLKADNAVAVAKVKAIAAEKKKKDKEDKEDYTQTKNIMRKWKQSVTMDNYEEAIRKMNMRAESSTQAGRHKEASILLAAIEEVNKKYRTQ